MPIQIASATTPKDKAPTVEAMPTFIDGDMVITIPNLEELLESGEMFESSTGGSATIVNVRLPHFDLEREDGSKHVLKSGTFGFYVSLAKNKRTN